MNSLSAAYLSNHGFSAAGNAQEFRYLKTCVRNVHFQLNDKISSLFPFNWKLFHHRKGVKARERFSLLNGAGGEVGISSYCK